MNLVIESCRLVFQVTGDRTAGETEAQSAVHAHNRIS